MNLMQCPWCGAKAKSIDRTGGRSGYADWQCGSSKHGDEPVQSQSCEINVLEATIERLQNHFRIASSEPTGIPCAKCGGSVLEFSIPNGIWNLVIRRGGSEGDKEYLCYGCWIAAIGTEVERLQAEIRQWQRRAAFNRSAALSGETWTQEAEDKAAEAEGGEDG